MKKMKKFNIRYDVYTDEMLISLNVVHSVKANSEQSAIDKFIAKINAKHDFSIYIKDIYEIL